MTENNKTTVIVAEVRTVPSPKKDVPKEKDPESEKWCCTRIQEARQKNANNTRQCWSDVIQILLESCGVFTLFVIENIIGIVLLILGIIFLNDCPFQPSIPIALIVYGIFSIIHGITLQLIRWKYFDVKNRRDGFATLAQVILIVASIIYLCALFWACFVVFRIYSEVNTKSEDSDKYCHPFLYWFSFYLFVCMAIIGLILILLLCCLCCFILAGAANESPGPHVLVIHQKNSDQSSTQPTNGQPTNPSNGGPQRTA